MMEITHKMIEITKTFGFPFLMTFFDASRTVKIKDEGIGIKDKTPGDNFPYIPAGCCGCNY